MASGRELGREGGGILVKKQPAACLQQTLVVPHQSVGLEESEEPVKQKWISPEQLPFPLEQQGGGKGAAVLLDVLPAGEAVV